jgi:hypothetical protein
MVEACLRRRCGVLGASSSVAVVVECHVGSSDLVVDLRCRLIAAAGDLNGMGSFTLA